MDGTRTRSGSSKPISGYPIDIARTRRIFSGFSRGFRRVLAKQKHQQKHSNCRGWRVDIVGNFPPKRSNINGHNDAAACLPHMRPHPPSDTKPVNNINALREKPQSATLARQLPLDAWVMPRPDFARPHFIKHAGASRRTGTIRNLISNMRAAGQDPTDAELAALLACSVRKVQRHRKLSGSQ